MKSPLDYALEQLDELTVRCPNQEQHRIIFDVRRSLLKIKHEMEMGINAPITVDVETAPHVLPPIVPIKDRKKASIDFPCPTCKAKPGKPCVKVSTRGPGDGPIGEPLTAGKRHAARRKAWNVSRGLA